MARPVHQRALGGLNPVAFEGSNMEKRRAFHQTYGALRNRMIGFTALSLASLDCISLQKVVDEIGQPIGSGHLT